METRTQKPLALLHIYGGAMKIGGHYRSGLAMAKGLIQRGHRVIVLAPDAVPEMAEAYRTAGAVLQLLPVIGKLGKLPPLSGWQGIADIAEKNKVEIVHSMDFVNAARGYRAAIKIQKPFYCTEAGADFISHFPPRKSKVVLFSDEQMTIYRDLYRLSPENLRIIKARIDTDVYHPETVPAEFVRHYGLTTEGLKIGIVTRLEARKDHKLRALLDFAKAYKNTTPKVNIYIVGDGACRAALQAEAETLKNPSAAVHFLGPIYGSQQVNLFYNACDVIIGSGRGLMEAMACKKAVIIPGEAGQGERVGSETIDAIAHYNFSGRHFRNRTNTTTLTALLNEICGTPEQLQPYAAFCFDYVRQHLSAAVGADQLIDWYSAESVKSTTSDFIRWYLETSRWIVKARLRNQII